MDLPPVGNDDRILQSQPLKHALASKPTIPQAGQAAGLGTQTNLHSTIVRRLWPLDLYTLTKSSKTARKTAEGTPVVNETSAFIIGHGRSSYRIEFTWHFGTFTSPWCSLRVPCDIDITETGSFFDMLGANDVVGFQRAIIDNNISLSTTVNGLSLFYVRDLLV